MAWRVRRLFPLLVSTAFFDPLQHRGDHFGVPEDQEKPAARKEEGEPEDHNERRQQPEEGVQENSGGSPDRRGMRFVVAHGIAV